MIHCSERDTQIASRPKEVNEFVGTWSIEGLREEGTAPVEIGWGRMKANCHIWRICRHTDRKNMIFLPQMGINTWVRSWIPDEEIVGMVIRLWGNIWPFTTVNCLGRRQCDLSAYSTLCVYALP